jgi:salicylate hydroxylase
MGSNAEAPQISKPINLAIIGGGLAGLALTIGLLPYSSKIKVTIYESAPAFAEIGVGVAFGPNVVRAMGLISPDIVKGFKKHATGNSPDYPELKDVWAGFRYGMDSRNGNGKKYGDLIVQLEGTKLADGRISEREGMNTRTCIHRARFLDELVALVPKGTARFGKRLVKIENSQDGQVRLKFADGEDVVADAVVGCDGIKSVTRPAVFGPENADFKPKFTGEYAYRYVHCPSLREVFFGTPRSPIWLWTSSGSLQYLVVKRSKSARDTPR